MVVMDRWVAEEQPTLQLAVPSHAGRLWGFGSGMRIRFGIGLVWWGGEERPKLRLATYPIFN